MYSFNYALQVLHVEAALRGGPFRLGGSIFRRNFPGAPETLLVHAFGSTDLKK